MAPPKPGGGKAKKGTPLFTFLLPLLLFRFGSCQIVATYHKEKEKFNLYWILLNILAVTGIIKLALEAGKATPAPPVGPALGSKGVNIMAFCKDYNARTADKAGYVIPVEITVYDVCYFPFIISIF